MSSFPRYTVVSRMVTFSDGFFPGKTIPGWSLSRKDVSRVVIFPDSHFPRMRRFPERLREWWRWSLTERPFCVYLNGFTVNLAH